MLGRHGKRHAWFVTGLLGVMVGFAAIALLTAIWVIFVGAFRVGVSSGLFECLLGVLLIERFPEQMRGRIMGTTNATLSSAPAVGIMFAAVLTEQIGVRFAALAVASIWLIATIAALIEPSLRNLESSRNDDSGTEYEEANAANAAAEAMPSSRAAQLGQRSRSG